MQVECQGPRGWVGSVCGVLVLVFVDHSHLVHKVALQWVCLDLYIL